LTLSPGSQEAQVYAFETALLDTDWPELEQLYPKISGFAGRNARAAMLKGWYEMRSRHYDKAIASLKRATAMAPGKPEAWLLLAQAYNRKEELATGREMTAQALQALQ